MHHILYKKLSEKLLKNVNYKINQYFKYNENNVTIKYHKEKSKKYIVFNTVQYTSDKN